VLTLHQYFEQFLRERVYLHNITPKTKIFYETAWGAYCRAQRDRPARPADAPLITRIDLQEFVVHLRERGVKPVSCNCWMRAMNAFCRWLHAQGAIPEPLRLPPQKVEKHLVPVHDERAIRLLLRFKPKKFDRFRVHTIACTALDTGCRIDELLSAKQIDFDFDNLLLLVTGKGRKQRKVPFSIELRKILFRFTEVKEKAGISSELMFPARDGGRWEHRNARRSYYCLLKTLGLPQSGFHLLRHTFATQYLKNGGDVVRLSIILGHSEISTTMKYLHLLTEDLQRPHQSLSILNRLR
jgi:integrase/recombinase XerD